MSNRPLSFSETLHQTTQDMQDIHTLLISQMKTLRKQAKRKKIRWRVISTAEHAMGVTFGVLAAMDAFHHNYIPCGFNVVLLGIGAKLGFDSNKTANEYADDFDYLNNNVKTLENIVNTSSPQDLHDIADIIRMMAKKHQRQL